MPSANGGLEGSVEEFVPLGDGEGRLVAAGEGVCDVDHRLLLADTNRASGAEDRVRTGDPLLGRQMLYR